MASTASSKSGVPPVESLADAAAEAKSTTSTAASASMLVPSLLAPSTLSLRILGRCLARGTAAVAAAPSSRGDASQATSASDPAKGTRCTHRSMPDMASPPRGPLSRCNGCAIDVRHMLTSQPTRSDRHVHPAPTTRRLHRIVLAMRCSSSRAVHALLLRPYHHSNMRGVGLPKESGFILTPRVHAVKNRTLEGHRTQSSRSPNLQPSAA